jgi:hypothetical protein
MNIQNLTDDETQTDEWEKIKDWAGGANKQPKHPIAQELERIQRRKPQKMDEGGVAGDDPNKILQEIAPPGTGILTPSPARAPMPPPQVPPMAQTPPQAPSPVQTPPPAVPAQPAPVPAPTAQNYDQQASSVLGTNPQELKAFLEKTNQPNWRQGVGLGLTGMADALSRAGKSNSNYEEQYGQRMQQGKENLSAIPGKVAEMGKEQYGLSEQLQAKDPNSPYSKVVQNSERPTLKQLGWTDDQIGKVPAVAIQDAVKNNLTYEDTQAKFGLEEATIKQTGAYQQGMLKNTAANIANESQHARAEETQAERDQALKENQEAAKHWITHPFKASDARSRLAGGSEESANHGIPELGGTFNGEKIIGVKKVQ